MNIAEATQRLCECGPPKTRAGDIERILADTILDFAEVQPYLQAGDRVLDLGCGYGRLGLAFYGEPYQYVGIDVNRRRVRYAEALLAPYMNCTVLLLDVANPRYNPNGRRPAAKLRLPFPAGCFAVATAISLFTHVPGEKNVVGYLRELYRLLRPGGVLISTWLTDPAETRSVGDARRVVYAPERIEAMLAGAGLGIKHMAGAGTAGDHLRIRALRTTGEEPGNDGAER